MAKVKSELSVISAAAQLLSTVLIVAALYFARDVFIPLALGLLLSFLLSPIVNWLHRVGVPNVLAVVTTAALTFIVLACGLTLLGQEVTNLVSDLPKHKDELVSKTRSVAGMTTGVGGSLGKLAEEMTAALEKSAENAGGITHDDSQHKSDDHQSEHDGDKHESSDSHDSDSHDKSEGHSESDSHDESDKRDKSGLRSWYNNLLPNGSKQAKHPNDGSTIASPLYVMEVKDEIPLASWASTAGTVLGPLATAGLVSVFAVFMLIHREDLRDRIIAVVSHGNYVATTEALDEAAGRISRYLIAQTIVNTSYGFVLTIGLVVIGATMTDGGSFPNAVLWGVLATCLRFVPYVGPTAAAIFPLVIALSVFPGYNVALAVLAFILVMELISNNVLEPWLYGSSTGISAVAVIVAAVFWGWLWGPVGLLLSTPLTVCLVVIGRYVPRFSIIATLLGEDVEIDASLRLYQRMLAGDEHRSTELLKQQVEEHGYDKTCDDVIVPTIKRIRRDCDEEDLSDADANRLLALSGGLIAKLEAPVAEQVKAEQAKAEQDDEKQRDEQKQSSSDSADGNDAGDKANATDANATDPEDTAAEPLPRVIGCVSHHFSESLVLNMLRIGSRGAYQLDSIESDTLPQDVSREIASTAPEAIVIVVLPQGGFVQARYLCRIIREEGYKGPIVIACLGRFKNFDKIFVRFRKAGATSVTTTYSQTRSKIESFLKRRPPHPQKPQPQTA